MHVVQFKNGSTPIELVSRTTVPGPERQLVEAFIAYVPGCLRWTAGAVAVFHEPQLESGFPDLVVVHYRPERFRQWPKVRFGLEPLDLKVLHHLHQVGGADATHLITKLGLDAKRLLASIERLTDARLVGRSGGAWCTEPLCRTFGVQDIVAIEAKIKNWRDAFHQGRLNQWFASESYILSPVEKPRRQVLERAWRFGVGIYLVNGEHVRRVCSARKTRIPLCYGSWLFNEWVGRYLHRRLL